ncbi:helix-turn-helix transcriptional regulator [Mucilaginibacter sp.]|uniref:helix-turn-helix domain-containing protein n=1 Tax=Mucilaginibacter sp. TaxID=1882438 RepID=UPI003265D47F
MIFYIKNMVCISCQMVVKYELEKLGLNLHTVEPGKVEIFEPVSADQILILKLALIRAGLELMDNKKNILVEKIVYAITEMIDYAHDELKTNFSHHLSEKLNHDYTYLANIFSETKGTTIEQFIILKKIQRVKQLICYNELNMTEISWKMHYSSVAHLSTQFKKITGITPSHFKHMGCNSSLHPEMCEL